MAYLQEILIPKMLRIRKNNSDNETETFNVTEANNDTGSMVIIDN